MMVGNFLSFCFASTIALFPLILLEAVVIRIMIDVSFKKSLLGSGGANIVTIFVGLCFMGAASIFFTMFSGSPITPTFDVLPYESVSYEVFIEVIKVIALASLIFLGSWLIEAFVFSKMYTECSWKDVRKAFLCANVVSYSVFVLLLYYDFFG